MYPANGVAEIPMACTDMNNACAKANSATLRRWRRAACGVRGIGWSRTLEGRVTVLKDYSFFCISRAGGAVIPHLEVIPEGGRSDARSFVAFGSVQRKASPSPEVFKTGDFRGIGAMLRRPPH
jgi:hypothetical protein